MKLVIIMEKNKSLINIEKNKDSNINVVLYQPDELSLDNIKHNYENVSMLEEEFSERLGYYSKDLLSKKLLPKPLQSDFKIVPRIIGDKIDFETTPITDDAYEKFPLRMDYTMKFKNEEEAKKFRENGIGDLIKKADETGKPIEIPNITSMKEFLGNFENPVSHVNKYGVEGVKMYICPSPLPPAQKYQIDLFNSEYSFSITTQLRLKNKTQNQVFLSNSEATDEPFNVDITLHDMKKTEKSISGRFSINISLRKKYIYDCNYNMELLKYKFLVDDSDNHIQVKNIELNENIFSFDGCGSIKHTKKSIQFFNRLINTINKLIFISKIKNIQFKYDFNEIVKNDELIDLVYCECTKKKYKCKKKMSFTSNLPITKETEKFCSQTGKFRLETQLSFVDFFGVRIELENNSLVLNNCSFVEVKKNKKEYIFKVESDDIIFSPKK